MFEIATGEAFAIAGAMKGQSVTKIIDSKPVKTFKAWRVPTRACSNPYPNFDVECAIDPRYIEKAIQNES